MCLSKRKKWVIGLLFLTAAALVIGYVVTNGNKEGQVKGTLVRSMKNDGDLVLEKLKEEGGFLRDKVKDGGMYLCEKMSKAAGKL